MTLDIKEILDYCICPMLYKFKYNSPDIKTKNINIIEKYDFNMHQAIYGFFSLIQNKESMPTILLSFKKIWGSLWIGAKSTQEIMFTISNNDLHTDKRKLGIDTILNIYKKYKNNPGIPIVINRKYTIEIVKNLFLTGTFEVVREITDKNKKIIELIQFKTNDRRNNQLFVNKDLELTAAKFAFNKVFNGNVDRIVYYGLDKNKKSITVRDEHDYKMLVHTIKCVAIAIRNKLFYGAPGEKCNDCIYKSVCINNLDIENMISKEK